VSLIILFLNALFPFSVLVPGGRCKTCLSVYMVQITGHRGAFHNRLPAQSFQARAYGKHFARLSRVICARLTLFCTTVSAGSSGGRSPANVGKKCHTGI